MLTACDEKNRSEFGQLLCFFLIYRRSLSVGITEDSASAEWTTEGSAEGLAEGTFGRSLISFPVMPLFSIKVVQADL